MNEMVRDKLRALMTVRTKKLMFVQALKFAFDHESSREKASPLVSRFPYISCKLSYVNQLINIFFTDAFNFFLKAPVVPLPFVNGSHLRD